MDAQRSRWGRLRPPFLKSDGGACVRGSVDASRLPSAFYVGSLGEASTSALEEVRRQLVEEAKEELGLESLEG